MIVHCDGSCYWQDKRMGVGIAFFQDEESRFPFREEAITIIGLGSSNEAEYHAVIQALIIIIKDYDYTHFRRITINTDSQLIFSQITGEWQCRNEKLLSMLHEVWRLLGLIKKPLILFNWVPRTDERQKQVDILSKRANPFFNEIFKSRTGSSI
jgi:ribonuclease HI